MVTELYCGLPGDEGGVSRLRGLWCISMALGGDNEGDGDSDSSVAFSLSAPGSPRRSSRREGRLRRPAVPGVSASFGNPPPCAVFAPCITDIRMVERFQEQPSRVHDDQLQKPSG
jgi:hypothetical protein